MTSQLNLPFDAPLHRERDRPPAIKPADWSEWIDTACVRGGVAMAHDALLRDFHACCPQHRHVRRLGELTTVHLTHWEAYWARWRPWAARG